MIITIAVIYLGLMLGIGYWANKRMKSSKEFLVAGQSLGFFVMAIASFSSIQSGWGMMGMAGSTSTWGIGAILAGAFLAPFGFALTWFLLGGKLRVIAHRHQAYSVPDLVRVRYQKKSAQLWMAIAMIIGSIGYMTAQVVAAGFITMLLLGLPFELSLVIGAGIVAAYTVAGGMLAAIWTDLIQGLIMIAMSIVVFFVAMNLGGGWNATIDTLWQADSDFIALDGVQPAVWVLANTIMIGVGMIGQPQLVHKFLMLRSPRELKWGATVAAIGYGITTLFSLGVGLAARNQIEIGGVEEYSDPDNTAPLFLVEFTTPLLAAFALTALLAAIMSSASSFITIGASAATRDLMGGLGITLKRELTWNRIASAVVTFAAVAVALFLDQIIYLLGAIGWAAFAGAIMGPIVLGLYWRKGTSIGALAAIIGSLGLNVFITVAPRIFDWWQPPAQFFPGFSVIVSGVVLYVVVSLLTQSAADQEKFENLYRTPAPASASVATTAEHIPSAGADRTSHSTTQKEDQ